MIDAQKKKRLAEAYGMGDIKIGQTITGRYPNEPEIQNMPGTLAHRIEMARARGDTRDVHSVLADIVFPKKDEA